MVEYVERRLDLDLNVKLEFVDRAFCDRLVYFAKSIVPLPALHGASSIVIIVPSIDYVYLTEGSYGHTEIFNMSGDDIRYGRPCRSLRVYSDILPHSVQLARTRFELSRRINSLEAELSDLRFKLDRLNDKP